MKTFTQWIVALTLGALGILSADAADTAVNNLTATNSFGSADVFIVDTSPSGVARTYRISAANLVAGLQALGGLASTSITNNLVSEDGGLATNLTVNLGLLLEHLTAGRAVILDSNKRLTNSNVTTVELGYVSGVTQPIQAQIDSLSASANSIPNLNGKGTNTSLYGTVTVRSGEEPTMTVIADANDIDHLRIQDTNGIRYIVLDSAGGFGRLVGLSNDTAKVVLSSGGDSYLIGGRLGLGTNSPQARLHVHGHATIASNLTAQTLKMTASPTTGYVLTSDSTGLGSWQAPAGGVSPTNAIASWNGKGTNTFLYGDLNLPNGSIYLAHTKGILISNSVGTAKTIARMGVGAVLTALNNVAVLAGENDSGFEVGQLANAGIVGVNAGDSLRFHTAAQERMRLINSGALGIGTNAPAAKLHVVGAGQFSNITADRIVYNSTDGTLTNTAYSLANLTSNFVNAYNLSNYVRGAFTTNTIATNGVIDLSIPKQTIFVTNNSTFGFSNTNDGNSSFVTFENGGGFGIAFNGVLWAGGDAPATPWSGTNHFSFWAERGSTLYGAFNSETLGSESFLSTSNGFATNATFRGTLTFDTATSEGYGLLSDADGNAMWGPIVAALTVQSNATDKGSAARLNFVPGTGITMTFTNSSGTNHVGISASAGSGEANTMSSAGGIGLVNPKSSVDLPIKGGASSQFATNATQFFIKNGAEVTNIISYTDFYAPARARAGDVEVDQTTGRFHWTSGPKFAYVNTSTVALSNSFNTAVGTLIANVSGAANVTASSASVGALTNTSQTMTHVDEIFIPASFMIPNATDGATFSTSERFAPTNRMDDIYIFSDATTNRVQFKLMFPENWDAGTIKAKFAWESTNGIANQTNVWSIQATAFSHDDTQDGAWGTAQVVASKVTAANDFILSAATPAITIAGTPANGDMISFRVNRLGGSADDAMSSGQSKLQGVWLQYTKTKVGVTAW